MSTPTERTTNVIERSRAINPHVVDALLALAFTGLALWTVAARVGSDDPYRGDDFLGIVLLLFQTLPIAARSAAPIRALVISSVAIALHISLGYEGAQAGTFANLVILYSAASLTDNRRGLLAALIAAIAIAIYFVADRGDAGVTQALGTYATWAAGWGLGIYSRNRREYTDVV